MKWIQFADGCQMPNIDEVVLWAREDGIYICASIDKDDGPWWNGVYTHWCKIATPNESEPSLEDQNDLWREVQNEIKSYRDIEYLKQQYTLTRK